MRTRNVTVNLELRRFLECKAKFWVQTLIFPSSSSASSGDERTRGYLDKRSPWCLVSHLPVLLLLQTVCLKSGGRDAILDADLKAFVIPRVESVSRYTRWIPSSRILSLLSRLWEDVIYIAALHWKYVIYIAVLHCNKNCSGRRDCLSAWEMLSCKCYLFFI